MRLTPSMPVLDRFSCDYLAKAEFPCVEAQPNHAIPIGLFTNPSVTEQGTPDGKGRNQVHS